MLELLFLVKKYIKNNPTNLLCWGLCAVFEWMYVEDIINGTEYVQLKKYIQQHYQKSVFDTYYWPKEDIQARIDAINESIEREKKNQV